MAKVQEGPRERLLQTAFRLLEDEGPQSLQARRLAAEIGTSTMAVYTHFGGMPGLLDTLAREGLVRFAAYIRARATPTDDPMADLFAGGLAYAEFALTNSQLYRLMFGLAPGASDAWGSPEGVDAFSVLLGSIERVIEAGRIRPQDATVAAAQVLMLTHGYILLAIGGFIGPPGGQMDDVALSTTVNLMVGLGDKRERAEASLAAAVARAAAR